MIRKLMALPCLLAFAVACGQGRTDGQNAGAGTGSETGALPADTGYAGGGIDDTTAAPSANVDSASAPSANTPNSTAPANDSAAGAGTAANQDQSGVTNTETGQSQLGDEATKTRPDEGAPVTSKGDTVGTTGAGTTSDTAQ